MTKYSGLPGHYPRPHNFCASPRSDWAAQSGKEHESYWEGTALRARRCCDPSIPCLNEREDKRAALEKLREIIRAAAPKAEECISYGLAAFRLDGKPRSDDDVIAMLKERVKPVRSWPLEQISEPA